MYVWLYHKNSKYLTSKLLKVAQKIDVLRQFSLIFEKQTRRCYLIGVFPFLSLKIVVVMNRTARRLDRVSVDVADRFSESLQQQNQKPKRTISTYILP